MEGLGADGLDQYCPFQYFFLLGEGLHLMESHDLLLLQLLSIFPGLFVCLKCKEESVYPEPEADPVSSIKKYIHCRSKSLSISRIIYLIKPKIKLSMTVSKYAISWRGK